MSTAIAGWSNEKRRSSSLAVLVLAVVVLGGALAAWWFLDSTPEWLYWALVGVLVLVLVFMVLLMVLKPRSASTAAPEPAHAQPQAPFAAESAAAGAPPVAYEPRVLTLRCGDCGTIFDVTDTGERPLYHTCPGCGAEGALRDPVDIAPVAPQPEPEPAPAYAEPAAGEAEAAPTATPEPVQVAKKIKLRCGGCKEVFSIEDTGERPLKRACPNCGRMGMIR